MSAIRSKDTTPEKLLGSAMWSLGLRYRKHYKAVGKPDYVFVSAKVAVFCDGDFWHGNNWRIRGLGSLEQELSRYSEYWREKILANIQRDKRVTEELENQGWRVLRIWESDIRKCPATCAELVFQLVKSRRDQKLSRQRH